MAQAIGRKRLDVSAAGLRAGKRKVPVCPSGSQDVAGNVVERKGNLLDVLGQGRLSHAPARLRPFVFVLLLLFVAETSAQNTQDTCIAPPTDLVSWWPGDGDALDLLGVNDGTFVGGSAFAPGIVGQAFSFGVSDDVVEVADGATLVPGPGGLTIDAWVNPSDIGHIFSDHYGCVNWESIVLSTVAFIINSSNSQSTRQTVEFQSLPLNVWSHIAAVWDGSEIRVYVDGELAASGAACCVAGPATRFVARRMAGVVTERSAFRSGACAG